MASPGDHLNRAKQHEASAQSLAHLLPEEGWRIVVNFYAALHIVDAYLVSKNPALKPKNHEDRACKMNQFPELRESRGVRFKQAYSRLRNLGWQVRYEPGYLSNRGDLDSSDADLATVRGYLRPKVERSLAGPTK
ncbi:MAG: hypothetical protein ABSB49_09740 [Polyangia bacterium]|jgi:hypothetical protein